jgi:Adenylate and Guanylate cyclase catalytic domain
MARFAMAAIIRFYEVIKRLELTLGPDTVGKLARSASVLVESHCGLQQSHDQLPLPLDLGMRIGMHSGPVTAGVLRGDRARFQLFGDTVNTGMQMPWGSVSVFSFARSHETCILSYSRKD